MSKISDFEYSMLSTLSEIDLPKDIALDISTKDRPKYSVPEIAKFLLIEEEGMLSDKKTGSIEHTCASNRIEVYKYIISNEQNYSGWKFINMTDQNTTNGLVAYTVDVGNNEGVFISRPTENFTDLTKNQKDNLDNIEMMLKSDGSRQQKAMLDYVVAELNKRENMNFSLTGTSKGGNNVIYAMVEVAKMSETQPELKNRLTGAVTTNSPGFNKDYIEANQQYISAVEGLIKAYQNEGDIVSSIGKSIGMVTIIKSVTSAKGFSLLDHEQYSMFNIKNENGYIKFNVDENGKYIAPGLNETTDKKMAAFGLITTISNITNDIDAVVSAVFTTLVSWGEAIGNIFMDGIPLIEAIALALPVIGVYAYNIFGSFAIGAAFVKAGALIGGAAVLLGKILVVAAIVVAVVLAIVALAYLLYKGIPILINYGMKIGAAAGIAIMKFLELLDKLKDKVLQALMKGFEKAVKLKKLIFETANALKDAVVDAVKNVFQRVKQAVQSAFKKTIAAIKSIFGSASSAISQVGQITVIISRIDDMQRRLNTLRTRYLDSKTATTNARTVVSRVSSFYNKPSESYVRNCCRDIDTELKNAQKFIDTAERILNKRKQALMTAVNVYHQSDQTAKNKVRSSAKSFA